MQNNTLPHEDVNQSFARLFESLLSLYLEKAKVEEVT